MTAAAMAGGPRTDQELDRHGDRHLVGQAVGDGGKGRGARNNVQRCVEGGPTHAVGQPDVQQVPAATD